MDQSPLTKNPYLLLTPGPLSTTASVKSTMMRDWCTWDDDYNQIVQEVRRELVRLAASRVECTAVLMQGSGTFSVEAAIGTAIPRGGKLLVLANGAYGQRIAQIAERLGIPLVVNDSGELNAPSLEQLERTLDSDASITHVAVVHCETTTGMLNPVAEIGGLVRKHGRILIVDAMSSFGGIALTMEDLGADFLISSANKCIQGVPGFGFIIARRERMEETQGRARSLSLDMYEQWRTMEDGQGKWRFTSPTHTVRAFAQALQELRQEGGVAARARRYAHNQKLLVDGMNALGFRCLLEARHRSPIITAFLNPTHRDYSFKAFYESLKKRGFVIYPGKVTAADTFRIGNIGDVQAADIRNLLQAVRESISWAAAA